MAGWIAELQFESEFVEGVSFGVPFVASDVCACIITPEMYARTDVYVRTDGARGAIIVFVRILFDVTFLRFFANFEGADGRGAAKKSCEF